MVNGYTIKREFLIKLSKYYNTYMIKKIMDRISTNMSLKRKSIEGLIKLPASISNVNLNNYLDYQSEDETLMRFMDILKTKLAHCDLSAFYERVETVEFENGDSSFQEEIKKETGASFDGLYLRAKNKVIIFPLLEKDSQKVEDIKTHELLHMASTRKGRYLSLCGFSRHDYATRVSFGVGLNEGYTEYLNVKYFAQDISNSYFKLKEIAGKIGEIIGPKKMEMFYFSNNINGLINELEKYTSRDKAIEVIKKMDMAYKSTTATEKSDQDEQLFKEIRVDVANIALEKYKQQYNSNKLSIANFKNKVYDLELFINEVAVFFYRKERDDNRPPDQVYFSIESLRLRLICAISFQEYIDNINNYYNSLQGNISFGYEPWTDSNGKTTKDYITKKNKEFISEEYKKTKKLESSPILEGDSKKENTTIDNSSAKRS